MKNIITPQNGLDVNKFIVIVTHGDAKISVHQV